MTTTQTTFCTSQGHERVPAEGTANMEPYGRHPYCGACLRILIKGKEGDPVEFWNKS